MLLAPIVRGRKGEYRKELQDFRKQGFQRVKIDGAIYDIEDAPALNKKLKHDIAVVVDRIVVQPELGHRLPDSIETALKLADGIMFAENVTTGENIIFSSKFACPVSGFTIDEIEPRLFSFNNPYGACPACDGLGAKLTFDPALVVPNENKSLADEAIAPWKTFYMQVLEALCRSYRAGMKNAVEGAGCGFPPRHSLRHRRPGYRFHLSRRQSQLPP